MSKTSRLLLILIVFVGGISSLGTEIATSRLIAPFFGTSLFVWANVIGFVLFYLTLGYYLGGRLADRYPRQEVLYQLTAVAAIMIGLLPFVSRPVLQYSQEAFATYSLGVFWGSLAVVMLLLAVPITLLGCVSPFAIRLSLEDGDVKQSGSVAGKLYAISTIGSLLGAFLAHAGVDSEHRYQKHVSHICLYAPYPINRCFGQTETLSNCVSARSDWPDGCAPSDDKACRTRRRHCRRLNPRITIFA